MQNSVLSNYWTATENFEALKIYVDLDFDGLRADIVRMLGGEHVKVGTRSFRNDMRNFSTKDDVLTLLVHLGYLGYDAESEEAFIPNKEIIGEFESTMSVGGWPEIMRILKASDKLLEDTISGDEDAGFQTQDHGRENSVCRKRLSEQVRICGQTGRIFDSDYTGRNL